MDEHVDMPPTAIAGLHNVVDMTRSTEAHKPEGAMSWLCRIGHAVRYGNARVLSDRADTAVQ